MKRVSKSSKKGFTLVELIVVLVILAILAAMLVPALTGYIRRAREEKEFQAASSVYAAAQALATEAYGRAAKPSATDYAKYITLANLQDLTGLTIHAASYTATVPADNATGAGVAQVTAFSVQFTDGGKFYNYSTTTGQWEAGASATAATACQATATSTTPSTPASGT